MKANRASGNVTVAVYGYPYLDGDGTSDPDIDTNGVGWTAGYSYPLLPPPQASVHGLRWRWGDRDAHEPRSGRGGGVAHHTPRTQAEMILIANRAARWHAYGSEIAGYYMPSIYDGDGLSDVATGGGTGDTYSCLENWDGGIGGDNSLR